MSEKKKENSMLQNNGSGFYQQVTREKVKATEQLNAKRQNTSGESQRNTS